MSTSHIDSFSGTASEMPKGKRTTENLLRVLDRDPMVSVWDMGEYRWLRDLVYGAIKDGLLISADQPYPWCRYVLTEDGRTAIGAKVAAQEGKTP